MSFIPPYPGQESEVELISIRDIQESIEDIDFVAVALKPYEVQATDSKCFSLWTQQYTIMFLSCPHVTF